MNYEINTKILMTGEFESYKNKLGSYFVITGFIWDRLTPESNWVATYNINYREYSTSKFILVLKPSLTKEEVMHFFMGDAFHALKDKLDMITTPLHSVHKEPFLCENWILL